MPSVGKASGRPSGSTASGGLQGWKWPLVAFVAVLAALVAGRLVARSTPPASTFRVGQAVPTSFLQGLAKALSPSQSALPSDSVALPTPLRTGTWQVGGRPVLLYVGADYCPYCAATRWPLIIALSRFGHFSGITFMMSSSSDVYANTPTFSFYRSHFASPYLAFQPVELAKRQLVNGQYPALMHLTAAELPRFEQIARPPYFPAQDTGGIPFLNLAGRYAWVGSPILPTVFRGQSWTEIASTLKKSNNPTAQQVLGVANVYTASICRLDGERPASICSARGIRSAANLLPALKG